MDDNQLMDRIEQTGELWGRGYQGSGLSVNAYAGPLPSGRTGIEFTTAAVLNRGLPPGRAMWTYGNRGVMLRSEAGLDFGAIEIQLTTVVRA